LKQFYWDSYQIVQEYAPHWITLFHDSFRLNPDIWGNFMVNCNNYALDTHRYQAWAWEMPVDWFVNNACDDGDIMRLMESIGIPVIVGEWSLATDNCAMWLNGFNDNVPGYPKVTCELVSCPDPYMGLDQPGAPPDKTKGVQGPWGTGGSSYVEHGMCPRDKMFENDDEVMKSLGYAKFNSYDLGTHGQFFWNFRTEFEPRWDFQEAAKNGWLPTSFDDDSIGEMVNACPYSYFNVPTKKPTSYQKSLQEKFAVDNFNTYKLFGALTFLNFLLGMVYIIRRVVLSKRKYAYTPITETYTEKLKLSGIQMQTMPQYQVDVNI
jgi:glucan 1,3-beta-glucosidase